jgi:uncharacterized protein (DUF433 family)
MSMATVAGVGEGIAAGPKATWGHAPGGADREAGLAGAAAGKAVAESKPWQRGERPDSEKRWRYLIARPHRWRKQLSLKGRNLTVGQLVSTMKANNLTAEQASVNLDLPREAVEEALAYYEENRTLIEEEADAERRWLKERGYPLEPTPNLP